MNILTTEALIDELLAAPSRPLSKEHLLRAYDFAEGLFVGHLWDLEAATDLTLQQIQGMHTLSHKQTFFVEYFLEDAGRKDAQQLGADALGYDELCFFLTDVTKADLTLDGTFRKAVAERSAQWARAKMVAQLDRPAETDDEFPVPRHLTVNYDPDKILDKAAAVRAFRIFFDEVLRRVGSEPDARLAEALRAIVQIYQGRLNTLAAVDVLPGLLSLEEQLTRSAPGRRVGEWASRLRAVAPAIGDLHELEGDARRQAREVYARHLDAIRQGAPFELDQVEGDEAMLFSRQVLQELAETIGALAPHVQQPETLTDLGRALQQVTWDAEQIKIFFEAVLREWGMLSEEQVTWQEVDDRDGFAPDGKFQVVVTPRRASLSVDSTRRIVNIPEDCVRPLAGLYPTGVLPLVAHELSHVLQGYADYELGRQIPLARIKGRKYRILREAGGVYQEKVLARDYFGAVKGVNGHYLSAYIAKMEGKNRIQVARVFYDSLAKGQQFDAVEDAAARELAVNRTSRLYRHGGQNSQVLDYVEQSIICDVLMQRLQPDQVDAFLLGSTSFSLEDSALLHRYGLLMLPDRAPLNPAREVMRIYRERFESID